MRISGVDVIPSREVGSLVSPWEDRLRPREPSPSVWICLCREPSLESVGVGLAPCMILGHSPRPPTHLLMLEVSTAGRALPLPVAHLAQPRRALS